MDDAQEPYFAGIVHYRDPAAVREHLVRMATWADKPVRVIVVDNSRDLDRQEFYDGSSMLAVDIVDPGGNVGYGAAANIVLKRALDAGIGAALFLTQDCRMESDAAAILHHALVTTERCAVTAPRLAYANNTAVVFSNGGVITRHSRTLHPGQGSLLAPDATGGPVPVDWADGACLMMDVPVVCSIGGFREEYFLYVEEVDLQYRLRRLGYHTLLVHSAVAYQTPGNYTLYFKYRNLMHFSRLYSDDLRRWPWLLAWPKDTARMLRAGRPSQSLWALRGVLDSVRGRMGPPPRNMWSA